MTLPVGVAAPTHDTTTRLTTRIDCHSDCQPTNSNADPICITARSQIQLTVTVTPITADLTDLSAYQLKLSRTTETNSQDDRYEYA